MRRIVFKGDEEGATRFQFLYLGFLRGTPDGGLRGLEVMRRAATILEKFEVISTVFRNPENNEIVYLRDTGDVVRELAGKGGTLDLEEQEFDMLKRHFEGSPQVAGSAKGFVDTADFLADAEVVKKEKEKK